MDPMAEIHIVNEEFKKQVDMKTSPLYSINWRDIAHGLIIAVGTPVLVAAQRLLDAGKIDFSWKTLAMAGVAGGVSYIIKKFFTPQTQIVESEKTA